ELALDDPRDDRGLTLGLDLIGHDETTLPRLEQRERVALDGFGIDEPGGELGQREQLGAPLGERRVEWCRAARTVSRGAIAGRFDHRSPPRERGRRGGAEPRVQYQGLGDG